MVRAVVMEGVRVVAVRAGVARAEVVRVVVRGEMARAEVVRAAEATEATEVGKEEEVRRAAPVAREETQERVQEPRAEALMERPEPPRVQMQTRATHGAVAFGFRTLTGTTLKLPHDKGVLIHDKGNNTR